MGDDHAQCVAPAMTSSNSKGTATNGAHTTQKDGGEWGMVKVALFYRHYSKRQAHLYLLAK